MFNRLLRPIGQWIAAVAASRFLGWAAVVAVLVAGFPLTALASFNATITTPGCTGPCYEYQEPGALNFPAGGWVRDPQAAAEHIMGQQFACSRQGTVVSVYDVTGGGTPYASFKVRIYIGTFYGYDSCGPWALAVRSAPPFPPTYTCPANSVLSGSQCTCSAGFDEQGGQCVAGTPFPPEGCASGAGGFFQCPNPTPFSPPPGGPNGPWQNDGPPATPGPDLPPTVPPASDPSSGSTDTSCRRPSEPPPPPANSAGNPISAATGNKYQREVDYAGPGLLQLVRHYNSNAKGWVHNHMLRIRSDATTAVAIRPTGQMLVFTGSGAGPWSSNVTVVERLTKLTPFLSTDPTWKLVTADDTVELYDANGLPMSVTARGGLGVTLQHAGGLLQSVSDGFGRSLQFLYDAQARLVRVNAPAGESATYTYGANGHLASVTYADGKSRQYLYENAAFPYALTGLVNEAGARYASWSYDSRGRAISAEHAGGVATYTLEFDPGGLAVLVTDPLGAQRMLQHQNIAGRLVFAGSSQPCANCTGDAAANTVSATGKVTGHSDHAGVASQYTYDDARHLPTSAIHAAGRPEAQTSSITWHPSFRVPTLVTEAGRSTASSYDSLGNLVSQTVTDTATGQARTWAWTYTGQGLVESITNPKGAVWHFGYDSAGNRTSVRNPLNETTTYAFDPAGRATSQTDPSGLVTTSAYDLRGRVTSQSRGGEVSMFSYTPTGELAGAVLSNGYQVSYTYDAAQRLIAVQDNRGSTIQYTLDAMGNRIGEQVRDANGNIALATTRVINNLNRVAAIQGAQGQTTALGYDANGEAISTTDPLNQATRQTLDGLRRPIATTFADNTAAAQAWNQLNQLTGVTDPKGVQTGYQTNAFGEVLRETSPDIGANIYQRDANGDVIAMTDAKGITRSVTRDALGRPTQITDADQTQRFTYDTAGNLTRVDDGSGATIYTRDAHGRPLTKTEVVNDNPSAPTQLKATYSWQGGELASIGYPSGMQVLYRRTAGRITGIDVQPPPNATGTVQPVAPFVSNLTHTALGQPKSWNWTSGDAAVRSFDADGRMTQSEITSYTYDAASRITGITQNLWASRIVTSAVGTTTVSTTELYQTPVTWSASYDSRNRLTGFARAGASSTYQYDANSNRLSAVETSGSALDLEGQFDAEDLTQSASQANAIDAASNRLLGFSQITTQAQGGTPTSSVTSQVNYTVDANGAMTSDGLRSFVYDASGRLSKVEVKRIGDIARVNYLTNALGQRVFKSEVQGETADPNAKNFGAGFIGWLQSNFGWLFGGNGKTKASLGTSYLYDEAGSLLGEYDNGTSKGNGRTEYIWLPTEDGQAIPIGIYRNGSLYQVHADHLGTPRLITDSANKAVWQWPYSAFGSNKPTGILSTIGTGAQARVKATAPTLEVNLRFPGQYFDVESNLSLNGFRSYRSPDGRYTQPDPIGLIAGFNRIIYANANTLTFTDPLGLANSEATYWMRGKKLSNQSDAPLVCKRPPPQDCGEIVEWCSCKNAITQECTQLTTCGPISIERPMQCYQSGAARMSLDRAANISRPSK